MGRFGAPTPVETAQRFVSWAAAVAMSLSVDPSIASTSIARMLARPCVIAPGISAPAWLQSWRAKRDGRSEGLLHGRHDGVVDPLRHHDASLQGALAVGDPSGAGKPRSCLDGDRREQALAMFLEALRITEA